MVRAILSGSKTQTRRICKPAEAASLSFVVGPFDCPEFGPGHFGDEEGDTQQFRCPYGRPGDRLWVREAWRPIVDDKKWDCIEYRADGAREKPAVLDDNTGYWFSEQCDTADGRWRPSIHMFRWASRITLEITDVRVEQLQGVSDEDALAEGLVSEYFGMEQRWNVDGGIWHASLIGAYAALWEQINGPDSWAANPWVWIISFRRVP